MDTHGNDTDECFGYAGKRKANLIDVGNADLRQHLTFLEIYAWAESRLPLDELSGGLRGGGCDCRTTKPGQDFDGNGALAASAARCCDPALSAFAFPESRSEMPRTTHP